jgi:hypothetical protein
LACHCNIIDIAKQTAVREEIRRKIAEAKLGIKEAFSRISMTKNILKMRAMLAICKGIASFAMKQNWVGGNWNSLQPSEESHDDRPNGNRLHFPLARLCREVER